MTQLVLAVALVCAFGSPWRLAWAEAHAAGIGVSSSTRGAGVNAEAKASAEAARPLSSPDAIDVDLYTIGPGAHIFQRFGHSIICLRDAATPESACYDYGGSDTKDAWFLLRGSLRGEQLFRAKRFPLATILWAFTEEDRDISRLRLGLDRESARRLWDRLEADANLPRHYAYHPYWRNCATEIRDRLAEVSPALWEQSQHSTSDTWRDLMGEAFRGEFLLYSAISWAGNKGSVAFVTAWQRYAVPMHLEQGVSEQGPDNAPEQVHRRVAPQLQMANPHGLGMIWLLLIPLWMVLSLTLRSAFPRSTKYVSLASPMAFLLLALPHWAALLWANRAYPELGSWLIAVGFTATASLTLGSMHWRANRERRSTDNIATGGRTSPGTDTAPA